MREELQKQFSSFEVYGLQIQEIVKDILFKTNKIGIILNNARMKNLSNTMIIDLENILKSKIQSIYPDYEVIIVHHEPKEQNQDHSKNEENSNKNKFKIPNIKYTISIVSCKGGVGKSTTVVNLANILSRKGFKIGILDADIYGPSIPTMLGNQEKIQIQEQKIIPNQSHNIKSVSMGYIIDQGKAAIWRGPIINKTLKNLFLNTQWGELDFLLIDTPPGTGDIHLSIAENFIINGSIIVTTPQNIAIEETERMIDMLQKLKVHVFGIIENMSYLEIGNQKKFIFGNGGGEKIAQKYNINFLGKIKINETVVNMLDNGDYHYLSNIDLEDYYKIWDKMTEILDKN